MKPINKKIFIDDISSINISNAFVVLPNHNTQEIIVFEKNYTYTSYKYNTGLILGRTYDFYSILDICDILNIKIVDNNMFISLYNMLRSRDESYDNKQDLLEFITMCHTMNNSLMNFTETLSE